MHIFPQIAYFKKASIESDQCHVPVQKVKELTFYQLLPYLAICVDFGWLSSGSEPVRMRASHLK